jgi:hypothetical protein
MLKRAFEIALRRAERAGQEALYVFRFSELCCFDASFCDCRRNGASCLRGRKLDFKVFFGARLTRPHRRRRTRSRFVDLITPLPAPSNVVYIGRGEGRRGRGRRRVKASLFATFIKKIPSLLLTSSCTTCLPLQQILASSRLNGGNVRACSV